MHPRTAHYLALDLARRFVADAPSERLVKQLATVYLKNRTAIAPVLRRLFRSPEFAKSVGQKYRRPFEHAVASMRALGMRMGDRGQYAQSLGDLRYWLDSLGQAPLGCPTPDGFKDFQRPWLSSAGVLGRWNLDMSLAGHWRKGFSAPDVTGDDQEGDDVRHCRRPALRTVHLPEAHGGRAPGAAGLPRPRGRERAQCAGQGRRLPAARPARHAHPRRPHHQLR
jgi:uncharacterized protein (DUF1800 family)